MHGRPWQVVAGSSVNVECRICYGEICDAAITSGGNGGLQMSQLGRGTDVNRKIIKLSFRSTSSIHSTGKNIHVYKGLPPMKSLHLLTSAGMPSALGSFTLMH